MHSVPKLCTWLTVVLLPCAESTCLLCRSTGQQSGNLQHSTLYQSLQVRKKLVMKGCRKQLRLVMRV